MSIKLIEDLKASILFGDGIAAHLAEPRTARLGEEEWAEFRGRGTLEPGQTADLPVEIEGRQVAWLYLVADAEGVTATLRAA